jgi:hypothetical protein
MRKIELLAPGGNARFVKAAVLAGLLSRPAGRGRGGLLYPQQRRPVAESGEDGRGLFGRGWGDFDRASGSIHGGRACRGSGHNYKRARGAFVCTGTLLEQRGGVAWAFRIEHRLAGKIRKG